jgi:predicted DNA-binding protein (UPF0251 family)
VIEVVLVPRRRKRCWVESLPEATYYKPAGVPLRDLDEVILPVEELEAIRLKDLSGLDQEQCAEQMGIARTTFQNHLYAAHAKIAEALVQGKALRIEGGEFEVPAARMFMCTACGHEFEAPFCNGQRGSDLTCPSCGQGPVCGAGGGKQKSGDPGCPRDGCRHARNITDARNVSDQS